jgi:crotonobetaine/carnitine-CoA ligase
MYTSGTTGRPKGVIVSHRMLRLAGEAVGLVSAARPGDVMLVWEPLYHIGGAQLLSLPMTRGVTLAMVDRFSASRFWRQAREYGASHIHYLGGILQILLKQPPSTLDRTHGVRVAWGGGCPAEIWAPFQDRFGVEIRECYGMTEASSITTFNDRGVVGSVGKPVPWFEVDLLRPDGSPAAPGERGEIVVRTSKPGALFPGYLDDPEATAKALRGGALHTGDLGSLDADGNLVFHGRLTDSVRCRGENVSAWEVEHVAAKHPAVEDCAMIGVAAEIGEQDIKLFVKPRNGATIRETEMSLWLGARLAPYQNPRFIALVEEFERTPSQRIMKHKLSRSRNDCWDRLKAQGR